MSKKHHNHKRGMSRRKFLGALPCAAIGTTTLFSSLLNLGLSNSLAGMSLPKAAPDGDYKALVCILLAGGNDSFNMLVPRNGSNYTEYANTRSNLALAQGDLLPLNFTDNNGKQFGLHPSMPEVQTLFNDNKLAFISNIGTLVQPTSKAQYLNNSVPTPVGLLSHADQIQQWQTSIPQTRSSKGWGGRMADILQAGNANQNISMNISLSGTNIYQVGDTSTEYAIRASAGGSVGINVYDSNDALDMVLKSGAESLLAQQYQDIFKSTFTNKVGASQANHEEFSAALSNAPVLTTNLQTANLLPNHQPFNRLPWFYNGNESATIIPANATDWVLLEVRDMNNNSQIIEQRAAFVSDAGFLMDMDGANGVAFQTLSNGSNYQLIVRSRNHLAVASANAIVLPQTTFYDMTAINNVANGNIQLKETADGYFAMKAGDLNSDGVITVADFNGLLLELSSINEFLDSDFTLDGHVTVDDFNAYRPNASAIGINLVRY